jgi:hypothetical protein
MKSSIGKRSPRPFTDAELRAITRYRPVTEYTMRSFVDDDLHAALDESIVE